MNDYLLLMHADAPDDAQSEEGWPAYFSKLRAAGASQGGSAIGDGVCMTKSDATIEISRHLSGYIRIRAESLDAARDLVIGNPVFEAGGTVEIRELPKS